MIRLLIFSIAIFQTVVSSNADKIKISLSELVSTSQHGPTNFVRKSSRIPVMEFIEQRLDNFDPNNDDTWQMVTLKAVKF